MNVAQVRQSLVAGHVLTADRASAEVAAWEKNGGAADDAAGFARRLMDQGLITEFQGEALLAGVAGPFRLGPYRVYDRVMAGRLGNIFRAVHEEFNQPVALKVFPDLDSNPEAATRLARETRVAVQVDHPNLVRTFQVGRAGKAVFLAIEDLRGETLAARLKREAPLRLVGALIIARDVARGLGHLHSLEIIHRDVQPANIWVTPDGRAKLMEFSAARDALSPLDVAASDGSGGKFLSAELLGSYDYLSAEQGADEDNADARSDVYSLGCVLFHCLTGEVVFPDPNPVRKMLRHAFEAARLVSDVNPKVRSSVASVAATMLAKNPAERYQRAEDVAWALDLLIEAQIESQERKERASAEINPEFLAWASAHTAAESPEDIPPVMAEPELIGFLHRMSQFGEQREEEFAPMRQ